MADLYLCGKGTGLIPLFDTKGAHIDCISGSDCTAASNRGYVAGSCIQMGAPPPSVKPSTSYLSKLGISARRPDPRYAASVPSAASIAASLAAKKAEEQQSGQASDSPYVEPESEEQGSKKAGLFGLPTYAVIGGVAVIGVAAFVFLTAKDKKG